MSTRNKLQKFAELLEFPHVLENFSYENPELVGRDGEKVDLKSKWKEEFFHNQQSLVLELACGRGEYTVAMAKRYPDINFVGVDIKGARIWQGARQVLDNELRNAAFLRTKIELLDCFFGKDEVDEIWITFPDPFLKESKSLRRLTSPFFLNIYRNILKKEGIVHLKTDSPVLYDFTLEVIQGDEKCKLIYSSDDLYAAPLAFPELEIQTYYEAKNISGSGVSKYLKFSINN
ncbi:MAG: tRNA (guanosine(46)-N7)-methyltransferase TrmB [Saprospiraceae bacterium]